MKPRFVARQMCSLDRPDELSSWLIIDTKTGIPLSDGRSIRAFTRDEVRAELDRLAAVPTLS